MSNITPPESEGRQLRRRDTFALALIAIGVLAVVILTGGMDFGVGILAAASIAALAFIYFLIISTSAAPERTLRAKESYPPTQAADSSARRILENLPIPVLVIGPGGVIERANPAAREFLGLGTETGQLSAALRQPKVLEAVSEVLRGSDGRTVEYSTFAPIESHVRVHVIPQKEQTQGAFPWRALLVLADETASKRAERMRGDFLANASHELRTPLASLAGFIETLKGHAREDIEARDRFLTIMQDQTERMRRLINDLLSLSRVEMDEHVAPSGEADLAEMTLDMIDALSPQAREKSITVDYHGPEKAAVIGDRDQLFEIAQNLIENAIKYSPEGQRVICEVEASVRREDIDKKIQTLGADAARLSLNSPSGTNKAFAMLRVRDAGNGIERRHLPRLSERFYRVDGQKSGPKEGTGLGLAIVKHIINRHRGGFYVESAIGAGSAFSVFIPEKAGIATSSTPTPDTPENPPETT